LKQGNYAYSDGDYMRKQRDCRLLPAMKWNIDGQTFIVRSKTVVSRWLIRQVHTALYRRE